MKIVWLIVIFIVVVALNYYFKIKRFNACYELAIWQTFLRAREQNEPRLFTSENIFLKFQELSQGKFTKQDHEQLAMKNTFENVLLDIKENKGLYKSVLKKGKVLDFSTMIS